jgi:hypothetical protein
MAEDEADMDTDVEEGSRGTWSTASAVAAANFCNAAQTRPDRDATCDTPRTRQERERWCVFGRQRPPSRDQTWNHEVVEHLDKAGQLYIRLIK